MEISSPVLQPQGATELGGRRYQLYTATDLSRGDRISVQITGINAAMTGPEPPMTAPLMVASGATLMLAGLGAAFAWRRRVGNQQRSSWSPNSQAESQTDERQQLIIEIAALDERHDQDVLPEDAYQATRAALMRRVISLSPDQTQADAPSEQPMRTA